jgi:hypothetical protein
MQGNFAQVAQQ